MATPERSSGPRYSLRGIHSPEQPHPHTNLRFRISPERQALLGTEIQAARARVRASLGDQAEVGTPTEKKEIFKEALRRDPAFIVARNELVVGHLGVVSTVLGQSFAQYKYMEEDLIEAGEQSLMNAAEAADPSKGSFTSYVFKMVEGGMRNCIRNETKGQLSHAEWARRGRLRAAEERIAQRIQGTPTIYTILEEVNGSISAGQKVIDLHEAQDLLHPDAPAYTVSLDEGWEGNEGESATKHERIPAAGLGVEDMVVGSDAKDRADVIQDQIESTLSILSERDRRIVTSCIMQGISHSEAALYEGMTKNQIVDVLERALPRMQVAMTPDEDLQDKIRELGQPISDLIAKYKTLNTNSAQATRLLARVTALRDRPEYKLLLSRYDAQHGETLKDPSEDFIVDEVSAKRTEKTQNEAIKKRTLAFKKKLL